MRWMRLAGIAVTAMALLLGVVPAAPAAAATSIPIDCAHAAQVAGAEPQTGHNMPGEPAPVLFASDFPALYDCEWNATNPPYRLGGWGGVKKGAPLHHRPVIFVHGNQADAENWYLVADYFRDNGGYTAQEMYALSYNGLGNAYAGLPDCCQPAQESLAYWAGTPVPYFAFCCEGGKGASDDPNVPDLYEFVHAVQQYTGSQDVDIVAHSLGVTITRKMLQLHPELYAHVKHGVMIAGANHGTTICRNLATSYYGCDEIAPGTQWLANLNATGETPGPTKWMSMYAGDNSDAFFQSGGPAFDDRQSPHLKGAVNVEVPGHLPAGTIEYHDSERVAPANIAVYMKFLQDAPLPVTKNADGTFKVASHAPGLPRAGARQEPSPMAWVGVVAVAAALFAAALAYSWIALTSRNSSRP